MAKLLTAPARFEPPGQDDVPEGERAVYLFKVPTLSGKADFHRAMAEAGAQLVQQAEVLAVARDAIDQAFPPGEPDRDRHLATIDTLQALAENPADADLLRAAADVDADWRLIELMLRRISETFNLLCGARAFYLETTMILAPRMFLIGWENTGVDFARAEATGVPEELLQKLPENHFPMISGFALSLFAPTRDEEKNSESPPSGPNGETPSTAASATDPTDPSGPEPTPAK